MRPNQQNNKNRSRGRNNNGGRKHLNPLSRNYESNGPDVKVRGNAAHVAEKYLQLARDAQSSGDNVMAENYLQHAEHYFRIVASAQPQQRTDQFGQPQQVESVDEDDDFPPINDRFASPEPVQRFQQPQSQQSPQDLQQPVPEGAEPTEGNAPADGQAAEGEPAMAGAEGEMPRRHRDRRSRRRGRGGMAGEGGSTDPSEAPQPEVGELPAFLTAGGSSAAE
jgi:hypothetical protein